MTTLYMRLSKKIFLILCLLFVLGTSFLPLFVQAQDTMRLVFPPPCIDLPIAGFQLSSCSEPQDIQTYIVRLYQFAVGISGIVAVGMIVYGAIIIIVKSENVTAKSEGKQIIQDALWGVLLLFASFLLLKTINPELVKLKEPSTGTLIQKNRVNTEASLSATVASSTCDIATNISGNSGGQLYNTTPPVNNVCTYRHLFDKDGMTITTNEYYAGGESIPANSIIWVYPYFIKSVGPSSAQCLVYAYRTPWQKALNQEVGDIAEKTIMTSLKSDLAPCILPKIPSSTPPVSQYSGWDEARGGLASALASTTNTLYAAQGIKLNYYSTNADCEPKSKTSAHGIMDDTKKGLFPYVCHDGCKTDGTQCDNTSGKVLSSNLIALLDAIQFDYENGNEFRPGKLLPKFAITSLTGGDHTSNNSNHYKGISADVVAESKSKTDTELLLTYIKDKGVSAWCEYYKNGSFYRSQSADCSGYGADGSINYTGLHIHVDYP
ncbi:hypothetical protein C4565_00975 [Candidatus Parcubacteria bacterium]|nr:MAG: hypothetical protein C4565_00975 [Candidatus Parcubacteria bacterium]